MATGSAALRLQADMIVASTWKKFHHVVEARVCDLEALTASVSAGGLSVKNLHAGRAAAHNLHGEMATFGSLRGSELAAEIESILDRENLGRENLGRENERNCPWARLDQLVQELRREFNLLAARYATVDMRVH